MTQKLKNIRPLIIGIGVAGKRHLEAQLNLGNKTGIYSTNLQTKQFYKKNSNVVVFDNLKDAIDWSNLVHICTPNDKHTEFVATAIKKRKAVFCEKSFTANLKDALYLQKLAHKYGATVIVGQNYRLTPTFAETRKRVLAGKLGTITAIETTYFHDRTDYQRRYADQNLLYIGGSHAIDLACYISDEKVVGVKAKIKTNSNYPNFYEIVLTFASGLLGLIKIDASSSRQYSGSDLKVEGNKGKLVSHNKIDELLIYTKNNKKPQVINLPNNKTLTTALEVKIVNDYLLGKTKSFWPLPDVDKAVNLIRILDAVEKAVSSGKSEGV